MEQRNLNIALQSAVTGFMPGVLLFMAVGIVGIPLYFSRGDFGRIPQPNWWIVILELLLLTGGFLLMAIILTDERLTTKRWRAILAGIASVILLGVLSVFTQGARLPLIMTASLVAGMLSTLSLLVRIKRASR